MADINKRNELDIYDIISLCLKNKLTLFLTISLFFILGLILSFYYTNSNNIKLRNIASINILIQENDLYSYKNIVDRVNIKLSSSYYFENWTNTNKKLSNFLLQKDATQLTVLEKNQIVEVEYYNEDNLKAITSYLDYVIKLITNKKYQDQVNIIEKKYQDQVNIIEKKYQDQKQIHQDQVDREILLKQKQEQEDLASINNEILDKKNQIKIARQSIIFLEPYIKQNKNVDKDILLLLLENKIQIEANLLRIDQIQSNIKKINQNSSKNKSQDNNNMPQHNDEIEKIKSQHNDEIEKIKSQHNDKIEKIKEYKNLISVGKIQKNLMGIKDKDNLKYVFISISALLGLFVAIIFVVLKNEYLRRKQSEI